MTKRAALYARKSTQDRTNPGKSVADQLREAASEAEARGWKVVSSHQDDGISASRHSRVHRPGYAALLADVDQRRIDAVVMAEQSRATRRLSDLGTLLESCADSEVVLVVGKRLIDPSDPNDLMMAGVTGAVDASESERTRQRVLRGMRGSATAGRPHGRNVYGYARTYDPETRALVDVLPDTRAATVRTVFAGFLGGRSLRSLAADLNGEGAATPTGQGQWSPSQVRRILRNPTYAGLRAHNGDVVGEAVWQGIVPVDEWRRAKVLLDDPSRGGFRGNEIVHYLTRILRCGLCGGVMRVLNRKNGGPAYTCIECHRLAITKVRTELAVAEVIVLRLSQPDAAAALRPDAGEGGVEADREVSLKRVALDEARAAYADGKISVATLSDVDQRLTRSIDDLEAAARHRAGPRLPAGVLVDPVTAWEGLDAEQRREVCRALLERIVVKPTGRGHRYKDLAAVLNRLTFEWKVLGSEESAT